MKDVIIIGGGLAGLINAIQLSSAGLDVLLIEKKSYPFHKVCGEYISNEAVPFLKSINAYPSELNPARIENLMVSAPSGSFLETPLAMDGFGISRYAFDDFLYKLALSKGTNFLLDTQVSDVKYIEEEDVFTTFLAGSTALRSKVVIGAYGKRSHIDRQLKRSFFTKRSPYLGVKYHIKTDFPKDKIALHNFKNGYCGISKIEEDRYCLCYLTNRDQLKEYGDIQTMEENILFKNKFLKNIFSNSDFLYEKPEVINEISFEKKSAVENHIFMSGDSAGMISPLCGNGMAMAIHSAKILSALIINKFKQRDFDRAGLEKEYSKAWSQIFGRRIFVGREIQKLFGKESLTDLSINILRRSDMVSKWLVKQTHGKPF